MVVVTPSFDVDLVTVGAGLLMLSMMTPEEMEGEQVKESFLLQQYKYVRQAVAGIHRWTRV